MHSPERHSFARHIWSGMHTSARRPPAVLRCTEPTTTPPPPNPWDSHDPALMEN